MLTPGRPKATVKRMKKFTGTPLVLDKDAVLRYIDQRLLALGLGHAELGKASGGISKQYIGQVLSGKRPVSAKIIDGLNKLDPENEMMYEITVWRKHKE
jgi:hypothetical protein